MHLPVTGNDFRAESFTASNGSILPYRLYVPEGEGPFPLVLYLHGAGERGTENQRQLGPIFHIFDSPESPAYGAIVVAPQCPEGAQWVNTPWNEGNYTLSAVAQSAQNQAVMELLAELQHLFPVDESRIYVTGYSMGGFGSWDLLARHPQTFAAGLPICGGGPIDAVKNVVSIPLRTFHGSVDPDVPVTGTRALAKAITAHNPADFLYTEWEGKGHPIWDDVYTNTEIINWLFTQHK